MLKHKSFFEGHRGAVLSLAGNIQGKYFYSSGSEGLIVKWNIDKPNEGEVLVRLTGYVSCLAFDKITNTLYAALNHKGIYAISADTGKIINRTEMPTTSFGSIKLTVNYIVFTSKIGEVIVLERSSLKMIKRIATGLNNFPQIMIESTHLWVAKKGELESFYLGSTVEKVKSIKLKEHVYALDVVDKSLIALTDSCFLKLNKKDLKIEREFFVSNIKSFKTFFINPKRSTLHALSVSNKLSEFKIEKKELKFMNNIQFEHIGQINCLFSIENHRFVISAGADKKIGVWQFN